MQLNVKNCLGPSHKSIAETLMLQEAWFDDNVQVVDDADFGFTPPNYEGPLTIYNAPDDEVEWVGRRMDQLNDLLRLREPVSMDYCEGGFKCDWNAEDYRRYDAWLAACESDDPMGDHHGRNY